MVVDGHKTETLESVHTSMCYLCVLLSSPHNTPNQAIPTTQCLVLLRVEPQDDDDDESLALLCLPEGLMRQQGSGRRDGYNDLKHAATRGLTSPLCTYWQWDGVKQLPQPCLVPAGCQLAHETTCEA